MRVLCVKWGDKYSADWVLKLKSMCARYVPTHQFVCITDDADGLESVDCIDLVCELPHWWQKVGMFQPGLFPGNNVYFDLDVVITKNFQPFLDCFYRDPNKLWTIDDYSYSLINPKVGIGEAQRSLLGGVGCVNSSVMIWRDPGAATRVWSEWQNGIMEELHGDQNWITKCLWDRGDIGLFPKDFTKSFRYGGGQCAPVVVFHGATKQDEAQSVKWIAENWR